MNNTPKRKGNGPMMVADKAKDFKGTLKKLLKIIQNTCLLRGLLKKQF